MLISESELHSSYLSQRWGTPLSLFLHTHCHCILKEGLSLRARRLLVSRVPAKNEKLEWAKRVARVIQTRNTTDFSCGKRFRKWSLKIPRIRNCNNKIGPANFEDLTLAESRVSVVWDVTRRCSSPGRLELMKGLTKAQYGDERWIMWARRTEKLLTEFTD